MAWLPIGVCLWGGKSRDGLQTSYMHGYIYIYKYHGLMFHVVSSKQASQQLVCRWFKSHLGVVIQVLLFTSLPLALL